MNTHVHPSSSDVRAASGSVVPARPTSPGELHTPGPWARDKYGSVIDANRKDVVFRNLSLLCTGDGKRMREAEANTSLLAAAPDFLKGAQHLIAYEDAMNGDDHISAMSHYADAVDTLRAAIRKATGAPHAE